MSGSLHRGPVLALALAALAASFAAAPHAAAAAAAAAKPAATPPPAAGAKTTADDNYIESVTVSVVNVDVYATDKKGRVTGLTRDDFQLFEDNRPVKITNYLAVENGRPVGGPAEPEAPPQLDENGKVIPKLPAGYEQKPLVSDDQQLRLIVYIDNYNLKPFDRNKVMRSVRVFLDQKLRRGDQVMLITYDRELHTRQPFTTDTALINNQLLDIEKISAQGVHQEDDRREVLRQIGDAQSGQEAMGYARAYAGATFNDSSFTIDAMKNMVTSLAGLTGRKAVLYVSDGLPMVSGEDVFYAVQSQFQGVSIISENSEFDSSRRFEELTASANANRVTFYTIDAGGLRTYTSTSAENATAGQGTYVDEINITNMQSPLQYLAEKTGGVSVINANNVSPQLDKIAEDFNSYYSLGYTPTHMGDGRFHKITVKVKRRGINLRYREGYRDKSIESRMSDGTLATLQFPFQTNPLGVTLDFGRPAARQDGLYLVPVNIKIPLGKLTLVPRGDASSEAKVRVFIGAMDDNGSTSEVQQLPIPIKVPAAEVPRLAGKHFLYTVSLLMRGGGQKVAVGLRDDVGAQESYVAGELTVR